MSDVLKKGVRYTIGLPEGTKRKIETDKIQTKLDFNEYMEKFRNGMASLQSGDMVELVIESSRWEEVVFIFYRIVVRRWDRLVLHAGNR